MIIEEPHAFSRHISMKERTLISWITFFFK